MNDRNQNAPVTLVRREMSGRSSILIVAIAALVNTILLLAKSGNYFLFSLYIPYSFCFDMAANTLYFPAEFYGGYYEEYAANPLPDLFFYAAVALAIVAIAVFVLLYFLSKKHYAAYLIATVLFGLDTLVVVGESLLSLTFNFDLIIHIAALVEMILGVGAMRQLKAMPAPEAQFNDETVGYTDETFAVPDETDAENEEAALAGENEGDAPEKSDEN